MMAFQSLQRQFLAHCRNPKQQILPMGYAKEGSALYVRLLYNKFNDSLSRCFPVSQQLLGETAWQQLLLDFIAEHRCVSPYYRQIPDEFIAYLHTERVNKTDPLYLLELAHFEWLELALAILEADAVESVSDITNWLDCRLIFAPVLQLVHYRYPVQRIDLNYQPSEPPEHNTHILGFRDPQDAVQFIELNPATARLIEILQTEPCTVRQAIERIAQELNYTNLDALFDFAIDALIELQQQQAILGAES